jgi:hypothetical protein
MGYTFCTLFDRNYLFKGLALHQSLTEHCSDFVLWILCMDDETSQILERMDLKNVKLIRLVDFEDEALRKARRERSPAEYCYTCTAPLILFVLEKETETENVAYLDADLFFYSDPQPIYKELGNESVLIIPHRFSPEYQFMERESGIYNVSMVIFRQDRNGLECLNWWKEQCLKACRFDPKIGLCYDQKYLDDWSTRFRDVHVLQHKGSGLAPWNVLNYQLRKDKGRIYVDSDELIFYHFHSLQILKLFNKRMFLLSPTPGYRFTHRQRGLVYSPYVQELCRTIDKVRQAKPDFESGYTRVRFQRLTHEVIQPLLKGNLVIS